VRRSARNSPRPETEHRRRVGDAEGIARHAYLCETMHTPCPEGYVNWHEWAEAMSKTHRQIPCPGCGLYYIWVVDGRKGPRVRTKTPA
jgi:hypothetical protein